MKSNLINYIYLFALNSSYDILYTPVQFFGSTKLPTIATGSECDNSAVRERTTEMMMPNRPTAAAQTHGLNRFATTLTQSMI